MKPRQPIPTPILAAVAVILLLCIAWDFREKIRWTHDTGRPLIVIQTDGVTKFELGLRSDGVVVWREITMTTNSPAETPARGATNDLLYIPYGSMTNLVLTNFTVPWVIGTNNLLIQ